MVVSFMVAIPFSLGWSLSGSTGPPRRTHRSMARRAARLFDIPARSLSNAQECRPQDRMERRVAPFVFLRPLDLAVRDRREHQNRPRALGPRLLYATPEHRVLPHAGAGAPFGRRPPPRAARTRASASLTARWRGRRRCPCRRGIARCARRRALAAARPRSRSWRGRRGRGTRSDSSSACFAPTGHAPGAPGASRRRSRDPLDEAESAASIVRGTNAR
jgi:hypothetical protein